ncbi:MAG: GNAT family N-acetyltransferase, partial [Pseudomonadota bacterium]
LVTYNQAPTVIKHLAIIREHSYRRAATGSGRASDLDRFDMFYNHLVLWSDRANDIIGGYRVYGPFDNESYKQAYAFGAVYIGEEMKKRLGQTLELGRSFIQPKYQKTRSLHNLFCAIGNYIRLYQPSVRYLYGAVSMSRNLPEEAQFYIYAFYRYYYGAGKNYLSSGVSYVKELVALKSDRLTITDNECEYYQELASNSYDENLKLLKARLNKFNCDIPSLFKYYTQVFGRNGIVFSDFAVDEIVNTIDGIIIADLDTLPEKLKKLYGAIV